MKRIVFLSLFVVVSLLSFNGCDDENRFLSDEKDKPAATDSIPKTDSIQISIVLNYDSLLLYVGESDTLIATVRNGEIIINNKVTWSTDNALVAEVDSNGVVTALSVGAAVITVTYQGVNYNCNVFVTERSSAYEYVDLGLSVYWATFNIGATKPEEFGDYYAWGETETKTDYSWESYKWCNGSANTLTKYCDNSEYGNIDNKYLLDPDDDVAHVKWGGKWYMPTIEEIGELMDKCSWILETRGNIEGLKVTGPNGKSIFLPSAGFYSGTELIELDMFENSNVGYIWSSNRRNNNFSYCFFYYSGADGMDMLCSNTCYRYLGFPVRPVCPSENLSIALDSTDITLYSTSEALDTCVMSNEMRIFLKKAYQLKTTFKLRGDEIDNREVVWKSDNDSVAIVSQQGWVSALSVGTANITATYQGLSATCKVNVIERPSLLENGYEYVDLGLSVKWATCNVGAATPAHLGNYYAWGETEPKAMYPCYLADDGSEYYSLYGSDCNYRYYASGAFDYMSTDPDRNIMFSKYNQDDNKTVLGLEDDVAHVKWGGGWRMPTNEESTELMNNCTWTETSINGTLVYLITSNVSGYEDSFIILPCTGYYVDQRYDSDAVMCWTSTLYTTYWSQYYDPYPLVYYTSFYLGKNNEHVKNCFKRWCGLTVRPVCQ